jgi:hypothetical protein
MSPERAKARGLTSTITFPRGNLAPEGSVIKSTAIDPSVVDADGVYRKIGPARVFTTEKAAIAITRIIRNADNTRILPRRNGRRLRAGKQAFEASQCAESEPVSFMGTPPSMKWTTPRTQLSGSA